MAKKTSRSHYVLWGLVFSFIFLIFYGYGSFLIFSHQRESALISRMKQVAWKLQNQIGHAQEVLDFFSRRQDVLVPGKNMFQALGDLRLPQDTLLPSGTAVFWVPQVLSSEPHLEDGRLFLRKPHQNGTLILEMSLLTAPFEVESSSAPHLYPVFSGDCHLWLRAPPSPNHLRHYLQKHGLSLGLLLLCLLTSSLFVGLWGYRLVRRTYQGLRKDMERAYAKQDQAEKFLNSVQIDKVKFERLYASSTESFKGQNLFCHMLIERSRLWTERICQTALFLSEEHAKSLEVEGREPYHVEKFQLFGAPQPKRFQMQEVFDHVFPLFTSYLMERDLHFQMRNRSPYTRLHSDPFICSLVLANLLHGRLNCLPSGGFLKLDLRRQKEFLILRLTDNGELPYRGLTFLKSTDFFSLPVQEFQKLCLSVGLQFSFSHRKENVMSVLWPLEWLQNTTLAQVIPLPLRTS